MAAVAEGTGIAADQKASDLRVPFSSVVRHHGGAAQRVGIERDDLDRVVDALTAALGSHRA